MVVSKVWLAGAKPNPERHRAPQNITKAAGGSNAISKPEVPRKKIDQKDIEVGRSQTSNRRPQGDLA